MEWRLGEKVGAWKFEFRVANSNGVEVNVTEEHENECVCEEEYDSVTWKKGGVS